MRGNTARKRRRKGSPVIEIEDLSKSFGRRKVLDGINLKLREGDFLTIFGPNGAGKTTLLRILATLISSSSGTVRVKGIDLKEDSILVRSQIGLISHNSFLYPDLTAEENLRFYGKMYGISKPKERISHLLQVVELEHRRYDVVRTFSRGMQQRLAIARALLHESPILFLDEPHAGLDAHATEILDGVLEKLRREDHTMIMATHNLEKGLEMCTSVAILSEGRIVFQKERDSLDISDFHRLYAQYVGGAR